MPWNDHTGPVPKRTEDELMALVRAKAASRSRRQRIGIVAAAVMLLCSAVAVLVTRSGPRPETQLRTVADGPVPSSSALDTTASAVTTAAPAAPSPSSPVVRTTTPPAPKRAVPSSVVATLGTSAPARPASEASTTTTTLVCRNSTDPACGAFRWDPPPGPNQPMTVAVSWSPSSPKAGDTVTFQVTVDDPDGSQLLSRSEGTVDYGDGTPVLGVGGHIDCVGGFGPWTPPDPVPVHENLTYQHAYAAGGSYSTTFTFKSLGNCAYAPSQATKTVVVAVS